MRRRALALVVTAATVAESAGCGGGEENEVTFVATVRGVPTNIPFVAFRNDGGEAWQVLRGTAGVYPFTTSGAAYELAWACPRTASGGAVTTLEMLLSTTSDVRTPTGACFGLRPTGGPRVNLSGEVLGASGVSGAPSVFVGSPTDRVVSLGTSFAFDLAPGTYDLAVIDEFKEGWYRLAFRRDVALTADLTTNIDLSTEGFINEFPFIEISGFTPADPVTVLDEMVLGGSGLRFGFPRMNLRSWWHAIPAAQLRDGDVQIIRFVGGGGRIEHHVHAPMDVDMAFAHQGPAAADVEVIETAPYPRLRATVAPTFDAAYHVFSWSAPAIPTLTWRVTATRGYSGGGGDLVLETPALSGVPGWNDTWAVAGELARWSFEAETGNADLADLLAGEVRAGLQREAHVLEGELAF
jgi:hypothetical protein